MPRKPISKAGQKRVSQKISKVVGSGEFPNTEAGRKKAAGMAYGMERSKRLGPKGGYKKGSRQ